MPWGSALERIGPAAMPGIVAACLPAPGLWHPVRTIASVSPTQRAREDCAWRDVLPRSVPVAMFAAGLNFAQGAIMGAVLVGLRLPLAGFLVAFALALHLEEQFRRTMLLTRGDPLVFLARPWSAALAAVTAVILIMLLIFRFRRRAR